MTIARGDALPDARLTVMGDNGPRPIGARELMGSGKTVLFAVPGAFTPTCSVEHLPGYLGHAAEIRDKGVDRIVCTAVNDIFVLHAWATASGVGDRVIMAADGNSEFARALGLEMDGSGFGMGQRSKRYALIIADGVVTEALIEAPGEFRVSSAENVLKHL